MGGAGSTAPGGCPAVDRHVPGSWWPRAVGVVRAGRLCWRVSDKCRWGSHAVEACRTGGPGAPGRPTSLDAGWHATRSWERARQPGQLGAGSISSCFPVTHLQAKLVCMSAVARGLASNLRDFEAFSKGSEQGLPLHVVGSMGRQARTTAAIAAAAAAASAIAVIAAGSRAAMYADNILFTSGAVPVGAGRSSRCA